MITTTERRKQSGIAIVSVRSNIKWRYESAGIPNGVYPVQEGNRWPDYRPPLVLDTIGMPPQMLVDLLANPPQLKKEQPPNAMRLSACSEQQTSKISEKPRYVPIIALAHPSDWRALRLLKLSPLVQMACPDEPAKFQGWIRHLDAIVPARSGAPLTAWMLPPAPDLNLDPLLLPALAVMRSSPSIRIVAERCEASESKIARMLRGTKATLGLPPGDVSRFRPDELAATILDRLGADAPLNERSV